MFQYDGAFYCENHIAGALRDDTFNACVVDKHGVVHSDITFVHDASDDEECDTCQYLEFIAARDAHYVKHVQRRDFGI